ncbi:MAG: CDP-diacylglycerol--glycerol-3-phosphate 3-phosphatidyltransferase [Thiohalomonadales bacterium]
MWTIPNILTVMRIALIPVFILAFYLPDFSWKHILTTSIFFFAGISDWFDGYLARKLDQQSAFGAFLDPVADKLMVSTALVLLLVRYPGFWIAMASIVIIGREIAVSALREWMAEAGSKTKVSVSILGKIKTMAQMFAIGMLIFHQDLWDIPITELGYILLFFAAFLTLWSMYLYLKAAWPSLTKS